MDIHTATELERMRTEDEREIRAGRVLMIFLHIAVWATILVAAGALFIHWLQS